MTMPAPFKRPRALRHLPPALLALSLACAIGACRSLPEVDAAAPTKATPTIATPNGMLSPQKATVEEQATGVPLIAGNKVTLLFDGPATMREMMDAARAATSSINLQTYIFDQDKVGLEFADLLIEKQQQGVAVNVMVDAVGALATPTAFFDRMRAAGIRVLVFNPVNPAKAKGKWELNNRNHRKLMVVDGRVAFTGGVNISATYSNSSLFRRRGNTDKLDSSEIGWRDTHIKIEGPAVAPLQFSFVNLWVQQEGGELPEATYFPPQQVVGDRMLRVLATNPEGESDIYKSLVVAINEAKKSIHLTSAYFVPDQQIVDALAGAARRGVDVRLVLPGVSDHSMIRYAGRSFYQPLLDSGVRIFELQKTVLHAKTAVIDSGWSTIGSANIDRRSFIHNYELNVVVVDPAFGRDMEAAFNEDLRDSKEVTKEQWQHRPWAERVKEWASSLADYWI
jgi:cardiolipin synthase